MIVIARIMANDGWSDGLFIIGNISQSYFIDGLVILINLPNITFRSKLSIKQWNPSETILKETIPSEIINQLNIQHHQWTHHPCHISCLTCHGSPPLVPAPFRTRGNGRPALRWGSAQRQRAAEAPALGRARGWDDVTWRSRRGRWKQMWDQQKRWLII